MMLSIWFSVAASPVILSTRTTDPQLRTASVCVHPASVDNGRLVIASRSHHLCVCLWQALLPAAGLLQLNEVKKACCEFLSAQLHPSNCLGIRAFADLHACSQLLTQANSFAGTSISSPVRSRKPERASELLEQTEMPRAPSEQHFTEVVGSEEFLNLGMEQVSSLIASDKLTIPTEEKVRARPRACPAAFVKKRPHSQLCWSPAQVFEAVIAWVNHDKDVRQEHLAHLMEHVRLPLLTREYLVQVRALHAQPAFWRVQQQWV